MILIIYDIAAGTIQQIVQAQVIETHTALMGIYKAKGFGVIELEAEAAASVDLKNSRIVDGKIVSHG